jgi:hypothetical protein
MVVWKDEETAVVGHQVEAIKLMAEVPSDPALPCCALPGGCGKSEKGNPRIFPACDIPKGFTDLGQRAQVMMLLHQFLKWLFFAGKNRSENDFRQVQKMPPDEWVERQHNLSIHHPERIVHFFRYLVAIIIVSGQDRITLGYKPWIFDIRFPGRWAGPTKKMKEFEKNFPGHGFSFLLGFLQEPLQRAHLGL